MEQGKSKRFPRQTEEVKSKGKERERSGKNWRLRVAKMVLVPLLLFFSLVIGLMIGYGGVGKKPMSDVFDLGTYKHMWDLMFEDT
ncbi:MULTISPECIES: DNA-directed RNA polymerase subunit beta [unclassified Brevibacillus]|uniref:DNA-directed RNA polymerase subunit beta n=1 Tax=unclassified Brevibacillus TaxID=2684853 RepID=UPI0002711A5D|nr:MULTISPECIES: DNA-directed RNA polymerase subunit beta [unclassified Brevibacillus]EJL27536.1 DNA-directed RNA polymerase subunit beta [Brevibacillus sp. BC25]UED75535.1 DNA-directed RNA polymerase subunit beta [Brevibacillus sp. DP1.3A]